MNTESKQHCQCGSTKFTLKAQPLTRVFCHCTICQEFNDAAFGDVTIFLSKDVEIADVDSIDFRTYKAPPAVQRGKCKTCHKPTIELFNMPLMPALTLIPSQQITDSEFLPEPVNHIFYHSRVADITDALPKYSGYMPSQLALSKVLLPRILKRLF